MDEKRMSSKDTSIAASQSLKEKEYWMNRFSGDFKSVTHGFPCDHQISNREKLGIQQFDFRFDLDVINDIKKISKGSNPLIFMILTAGIVALMYKYTGATDIMICAPIYRQKIEADFINTLLVLRNQPVPRLTFKDLLMQVRESTLQAVENQNYPLKNLLYDLNPFLFNEGELVIETAVLLENIHDPAYIRDVDFNCCFCFKIVEEMLELSLHYNSQCYEKDTIDRLLGHYALLMKEALADVNIRLGQLNILSDQEQTRLLYEFNRYQAAYPGDTCIHRLFARQAENTPGAIAVTYENQRLSFGELHQKSNGLAGVLREKGVSSDSIVAIIMEPSIQLAVAILGVLKAGAAYLPIDPTYPKERIDYMLKDSKVRFLVIESNKISYFRDDEDREIINIDEIGGYSFSLEASYLNRSLKPGCNLAYVIYTSGSTGRPRGVLIEHASILNYIYWRIAYYAITARDVALQMVSVAFDGFVANFYPGILTGGRVVFLNLTGRMDVDYIRSVLGQEGITHFSVVPSIYGMLLEGADSKNFNTLRFVALAGEKAAERIIKTSQRLLPRVQLINEYGPTENSVAAAANTGITMDTISIIGTPIANNRIYILDENNQIVPLGVFGELCTSGSGVARGYLNAPEQTDKKFCGGPGGGFSKGGWHPRPIKNGAGQAVKKSGIKQTSVFSTGSGQVLVKGPPGGRRQKIYKTGDLARWLPDGRLEISGRIDHQVQVRGGRIELEEIERYLLKHENIKEAVVVAKKDKQGDIFLCAYVVCFHQEGAGCNIDINQFKEFLAKQLPEFIVPARFVELEQIPLNVNRKADRKLLAEMEISRGDGTEYTAPRDEMETKLVEMWQRLLDIERVGIRDNFFNIGGDSIKVISLINSINKEFGTNLKAVDLYEHETIEKVAIIINKNRASGDEVGVDQNTDLEQARQEIDELKNSFLEGI